MITFEQLAETAESAEIGLLDFSVFRPHDVLNLIMQRSQIIEDHNVGARSPVVIAWLRGDPAPGLILIDKAGDTLLRRAAAVVWLEYQQLKPTLMQLDPRSLADIGCGYAIFDLFFWRDFPGRLLLIDIENSDARHFGFEDKGAAYSDLDVAAAFLADNGVNADDITCLNPEKQDLDAEPPVDLAVSFISCGFHYPCSTYETFFRDGVAPNGHVILDLRARKAQRERATLEALGTVSDLSVVAKGNGRRVLLHKASPD